MSSEKISEDIESIKDNLFKISTKIDNQNLAIQILKGESNNNNSIVSNHLSYLENNKVSMKSINALGLSNVSRNNPNHFYILRSS